MSTRPTSTPTRYQTEYQAGKSYYMSQNFMERLFTVDDPRIHYYFYRQTAIYTVDFTPTGNGYFGRYTGDATANSNDNSLKATVGVYLAGGLYDNSPINNLTAANVFITNTGATSAPKTVTAFVANRMAQYDAASAAGKLSAVMTQKYIAQFGNEIESYNDYRRTRLPALAAPIAPLNSFSLRLSYSITELTTNGSVSDTADQLQTAQQTTPVFWGK